jgi:hypothetical protein
LGLDLWACVVHRVQVSHSACGPNHALESRTPFRGCDLFKRRASELRSHVAIRISIRLVYAWSFVQVSWTLRGSKCLVRARLLAPSALSIPPLCTYCIHQHARLTVALFVSHAWIRIRWHLMGSSEILLLRNSSLLIICNMPASRQSSVTVLTLSAEGPVASCCFRKHAKRRDVTARPDLPASILLRLSRKHTTTVPVKVV